MTFVGAKQRTRPCMECGKLIAPKRAQQSRFCSFRCRRIADLRAHASAWPETEADGWEWPGLSYSQAQALLALNPASPALGTSMREELIKWQNRHAPHQDRRVT
jgi:endogenous inhibitor of DNA gyrase (YacG/DUF329 family)